MNNSGDNRLVHSNSAISVTHEFYNKKFMVYVEGPDDVPFWDEVFNSIIPQKDFELKDVGGKENFPDYINGIKLGEIKNVIIACDKDYTNYMDVDPYNHPLIVTSYGYSIENSMFCPYRTANYIKVLARNRKDYLPDVNAWYIEFCDIACKLLPYDIMNYIKSDIGVTCFGDNCCRFLTSKNSPMIDDEKITDYINSIKSNFNEFDLDIVKDNISKDRREYRYIIKGHFITNGIINLIKKKVYEDTNQKPTLSYDAIYAQFVNCKRQCGSICVDRQYLIDRINNAISNI